MEIVEIRDKLKADLAVVERFLEIAKARGINGAPSGIQVHLMDASSDKPASVDNQRNLGLNGGEPTYGAISDIVREGIRLAPEKYTIRDIHDFLRRVNKPLSKGQIATVLDRLRKRNEVEVYRKGKGSKPTVFKKPLQKIESI